MPLSIVFFIIIGQPIKNVNECRVLKVAEKLEQSFTVAVLWWGDKLCTQQLRNMQSWQFVLRETVIKFYMQFSGAVHVTYWKCKVTTE